MQIGGKTVEVSQFVKRGDRDKPNVDNYTNLYVKNFPDSWDEAKINSEFGEFGTVTSMALRDDNKGRKFAFVNFETTEQAKACVEAMHMKEMRTPEEVEKAKEEGKEDEVGIDGHPVGKLYVQRAQSKTERQTELREKFSGSKEPKQAGVNLYVKNLDENTDEAGLRALFESFGQITSVATPTDDKGKCKGFGFVCFASPDEATKAVTEMHLKVVKGKPLYVGLAEKREARQERLRQRYAPGAGGMPGAGPKGGKGGGGKEGKGMGMGMGMMPQMYGGGQGFQGPMPMAAMGMMGKGPQMMGMMPPQMMGMMPPQAGGMTGPKGAMMGPKGPMMHPQMMGMMGKPGMMPGKGCPGMMPMGGPMPGQMGMMRPPMQQMQMGMRPGGPGAPGAGQQAPQQAAAPAAPGGPLNAAALAAAPPPVQKQMIGEKLYPAIAKLQPELAGKITGMMLEMDNSELLILLESEPQLKNKVDEALRVLEQR